ncbi:MAG: DUF3987 domain-containing protein [Paludibacteraceae bacterium]|nr:DUF3987 domain-containing protein [Paludibacteraceae bacterium]
MSKKIFNPQEWLNTDKSAVSPKSYPSHPSSVSSLSYSSDIEEITRRIESAATDIAPAYADWRDLGFALAYALGESGRTYYQRLSRFYPNYAATETDKQFNKCLNAHNHGVTVKTLFHLAKQAGISVAVASQQSTQNFKSSKSSNGDSEDLRIIEETVSTFPEEVYSNLPVFLQHIICKADSPEDADLLLLGSLTVFSSCLPNVYGIYNQCEVFPNLFLFVSAKASAGKGRLSLCRRLVAPIHNEMREICKVEQERYQMELAQYVATKNKEEAQRPQEPPLRTLFIPANNSATGLFQLLKENDEKGLIFETEGDTLAQTFKSEHGNYSDGFRKAFHHEPISYNRRKDREFVELSHPQLSALLSGTPKQVLSLIPDAENGLFSRFLFYYISMRPYWKDVFASNDEEPLEAYFDKLALNFKHLYSLLKQQPTRTRFCLSKYQQQQFNEYFEQSQLQYLNKYGDSFVGTVRRLGLSTFRIAMILSVIRTMESNFGLQSLVCSDNDFQTAMIIAKTLHNHASYIFEHLPQNEQSKQSDTPPQMRLLLALPPEFDRPTYLSTAQKIGIPDKTAEKQIETYLKTQKISRIKHGLYSKATEEK